MATYTLTKAERETHILWNDADPIAVCDTASPVMIRMMDALTEAYPYIFRCVRVDPLYNAKRYEFHHKHVRIKKPASEAQKQAALNNGRANLFCTKNNSESAAVSEPASVPEEIIEQP